MKNDLIKKWFMDNYTPMFLFLISFIMLWNSSFSLREFGLNVIEILSIGACITFFSLSLGKENESISFVLILSIVVVSLVIGHY